VHIPIAYFLKINLMSSRVVYIGSSMAVPSLRQLEGRLSQLRPIVCAPVVHVGFVVEKAAVGQILSEFFGLSPVNIFPPWNSILIYIVWR
jgi:hypothetical protein